jgi:hypothetical protein
LIQKRIKGFTHAASLAVFVRALLSCKPDEKDKRKEKIEYALRYLADGGKKVQNGQTVRQAGTDALFALNTFYTNLHYTNNALIEKKIYQTTANMLNLFLKGVEPKNASTGGKKAKIEIFPIPPVPFLSKNEDTKKLMSFLGAMVYTALINWGKKAQDGISYKPIDIAKEVCQDPIFNISGEISPRSISNRFSSTIKELNEIEFLGGILTPCRNGKRIDYYTFHKN